MTDRLTDLLTFVRVAEFANFSAAARDLKLSPSAVSRLVSRLEARLGTRLIRRNARGVTLTAEGEIYYRRAVVVVEALAQAEDSVKPACGPRGKVRVYCMPTFAGSQLAPILPGFLAAYPEIQLEFVLGIDPVNPGVTGYDLVIRSGMIADSQLVAYKLATSRWVLCASPEYLSRRGRPRTPDDLDTHDCLVFSRNSELNVWPFSQNGTIAYRRVTGRFSSSQGDMLIALARRGAGIARLTEYHVQLDLADGRLVEVLQDYETGFADPMYAIYEPRRTSSPRVQVFVDYIKAAFAKPSWSARRPCTDDRSEPKPASPSTEAVP